MFSRCARVLLPGSLLAFGCVCKVPAFAQQSLPFSFDDGLNFPASAGPSAGILSSNLQILLQAGDGNLIEKDAIVTLVDQTGKPYRQSTAKSGYAKFARLAPAPYKIIVLAPGFERETVEVDAATNYELAIAVRLRESNDEAGQAARLQALPAKAQKELGKALGLMDVGRVDEAQHHLEMADRFAPNRAEVSYLFGLFYLQEGNPRKSESYWTKTLELNPDHLPALLSLGELYLQDNQAAAALPYLNHAVNAQPSNWRAHAFLAQAEFSQGAFDGAIEHAQRALELGHSHAEKIQPLLAAALAKHGQKDRAISLLQSYVKDHRGDPRLEKQLENLRASSDSGSGAGSDASGEFAEAALAEALSMPDIANWRPPDVDEKVPPVEALPGCKLQDVLRETGKRTLEFIRTVDRFTATELLTHESINKWGLPSAPEERKFDYIVSIQESPPGVLNVEEYRRGSNNSPADFPDGVATNGLPALMLVFHPAYMDSFEMSCEGLAHSSRGLAWQVHFRQRSDKPNHIRAYKMGINGPSYPVALKGRAWIAVDTFEVARMETDMIAPIPEIRLFTDHTAVEYGPVRFQKRQVDLWLPRTAEVYYDWKGRRIHRQHNFRKYLLFSVDDTQKFSDPTSAQDSPADPAHAASSARP